MIELTGHYVILPSSTPKKSDNHFMYNLQPSSCRGIRQTFEWLFFPPFDLSEQVNHNQPVYKPWGLPYGGMPPVGRARGSLQTSFTLDLTVILYYVSPKFPEAWFLLSRADRSLDHPAGAANSSCVQLSAAAPTANLGLTLRAVERCYQNTWWIFLCVSFGAGVRQTVFFRKVFP